MNDAILNKLKIVVERAVRPVRARSTRKRKMREELLAHLVSIFEEETERVGDEQAALAEAKRRFGDAKELTSELQESVSRWEQVGFLLERSPSRPGESVLRLAWDHGLLVFVAYAAMTLLMLPVLLIRGRQSELGTILFILFVLAAVIAAFSFVFALLLDRMALALCKGDSGRTVRKVARYSLASLPILPAATFLLYWGLSIDLPTSLFHLRFACCLAPAFPVLLIVMARVMAEERRYEEEWASLEIGE